MKISILTPSIKPGGAEKQAALLAAVLSADNEVHFISFCGKRGCSEFVRKYLEDSPVFVHYLEGSLICRLRQLFVLLKEESIEAAFNYITFCDVIGAIVEKLAGVRVVYNGIRNSRLPILKLAMEWFVHNFIADYTIYNSYSGARYFERRGFCRRKTIVISNCFPKINDFLSRPDRKVKTVITVGRFESQKDYRTAIMAMAELEKTRDDVRFVVVGHGHLESKVRMWVNSYGISAITTIYVAPNNVQELLRISDIYLSTSLFEGTSNSIMEALNWSVPVVATDVGDNHLLVRNNENGYLLPVGDYRGIAAKLNVLLDDYRLRCRMGSAGNKILCNFSEDVFRENYRRVLREKK